MQRLFGWLVDISMATFVTPRIVSVLYVLGLIIDALVCLGVVIERAVFFGQPLLAVLLAPFVLILFLVIALLLRIVLEVVVVQFKIAGHLKTLAEASQAQHILP